MLTLLLHTPSMEPSRPESWYLENRADSIYENADLLRLAMAVADADQIPSDADSSDSEYQQKYWIADPYIG